MYDRDVFIKTHPNKPLTKFADYIVLNHLKLESKLAKYMVWHQ